MASLCQDGSASAQTQHGAADEDFGTLSGRRARGEQVSSKGTFGLTSTSSLQEARLHENRRQSEGS